MRIIAELCQNHNGDLSTLEEMIVEASKVADIVKIQTIQADTLTLREEYEEYRPYERESLRLQKLELSEENEKYFINRCRELGVEPMTTLFSTSQIDRFNRLGYKKLKISGYAIPTFNYGLELKNINFDELFFSTSSLTLDEIERTIFNLRELGIKFTMLQCTCIYPTPYSKLNLHNISFYKEYFDLEEVGFSDHSSIEEDGIEPTLKAIFSGATVVERHFTVLPHHRTRDGKVSVNTHHLARIREFSSFDRKRQYNDLNGFNKQQKFNHDYYRGRFK